MKIRNYIIAATTLILLVCSTYFIWFYFILDYRVSTTTAEWGQLGDYVGGTLNPLLSFVSIVLLIKSLILQFEANGNLKTEIENSKKTEKLRSFELIFFNLINSQKNLFDSFKYDLADGGHEAGYIAGAKAVIRIEDTIEDMRSATKKDNEIADYINNIDDNDRIFGLTRAFYIIVMLITDRLSDNEGFSLEDRRSHFKALINLTDFAQLRLIMICVQFMEFESTKYLRASNEFNIVIKDLGLGYELY